MKQSPTLQVSDRITLMLDAGQAAVLSVCLNEAIAKLDKRPLTDHERVGKDALEQIRTALERQMFQVHTASGTATA